MDNCNADHIVPVAKGGEHDLSNLQCVTSEVNRAKGTMTQDEFVAMCIKVARLHGGM